MNFKFCPFCGKELSAAFRFCPFCGADLTPFLQESAEETAAGSEAAPVEQEAQARDMTCDVSDTPVKETDDGQESEQSFSHEAVRDVFRILIENDLKSFHNNVQLCRIRCLEGDFQKAEEISRALIEKYPCEIEGYVGLIRAASRNYTLLHNSKIDEAIAFLRNAFPTLEPYEIRDAEHQGYMERYELRDYTIENGVLTAYNGSDADLILPRTGFTRIGRRAFGFKQHLKSIVIPGTVEYIENDAFQYCHHLSNVTLENGVRIIEPNAFEGCSSLKELILPDSIEKAPTIPSAPTTATYSSLYTTKGATSHTFKKHCQPTDGISFRSLKEATVCGSVQRICQGVFTYNHSLTKVTIQNGVSYIEASAFQGCTALQSIRIPGSVKVIGANAFRGCSSLKEIIIESGVESIGESAFRECNSATSVTIPDTVKTIGSFAFSHCPRLVAYCQAKSKPNGWDTYWMTNDNFRWGQ